MNLYLNDTLLEFKIDTGAEVTVIPESVATPFQSLLQKFSLRLQGPVSVQVCGQFTGALRKDSRAIKEEIFVMKNLHTSLLVLPAITNLNQGGQ